MDVNEFANEALGEHERKFKAIWDKHHTARGAALMARDEAIKKADEEFHRTMDPVRIERDEAIKKLWEELGGIE